jgi:hypothetical protein
MKKLNFWLAGTGLVVVIIAGMVYTSHFAK